MNLITRHAWMDSLTYAPTPEFVRAGTAATELVVAADPAFDFASAEYRALHRHSRATAFQAPDWLAALQHDVAPSIGAEPVTIAVRDRTDGRLVMVLPLARHRVRSVTFLTFADFGLCDYLGPVYDPADAALLLADTTLPQQVAAALPHHDVLRLDKLAPGDALLEQLFPRACRARMRVSAYPVKIKSDWESWRAATLDNGFRRDLDMKRRRIVRRGAPAFALLDHPQEITRAF